MEETAVEAREGKRQWYVVHTYSGYEHKVKAVLEERVRAGLSRLPGEIATLEAKPNKSEKDRRRIEEAKRELRAVNAIGDVLVPAEKVVELVKGQKRTSSRKFFPGYILVNMQLNDDTWHVIKSTPKVTGFVGGATNPPAISEDEVRGITRQMEEGAVKPKPKVLFESGESVKVIDGPFQDFSGVVEDVRPDKGKLRVLISIFGRATPVELDFVQVEKA
jgi:transcriptional antiterminator NusG